MDLGTDLRSARERAGVSLPELAARTKIPEKSLRAIEENDFASIPKGIFARSFIRTYAREVGVDPDAAISEYRARTEPKVETANETHESLASLTDEDIRPDEIAPNLSKKRPGWGYSLVTAALLIGLIGVNWYAVRDQAEAPAARATVGVDASSESTTAVDASSESTTAVDTSHESTTAADASPESTTTVATTGGGVLVEMRAQGLCWVKATVDGQIVFERLMQPGETETLTGQQEVTVRVGDPSTLAYSVNGRPGQPLGEANIPVTVRFGPDGLPARVS